MYICIHLGETYIAEVSHLREKQGIHPDMAVWLVGSCKLESALSTPPLSLSITSTATLNNGPPSQTSSVGELKKWTSATDTMQNLQVFLQKSASRPL
jgi:hypothetical protein